jgi:glyoxylate reductase
MQVLYHSRRPATTVPPWCEYIGSVEALCREADVLSVHIPLNAETIGLIGKSGRSRSLINTARGRIVDEWAMIRALEDGHVSLIDGPNQALLIHWEPSCPQLA